MFEEEYSIDFRKEAKLEQTLVRSVFVDDHELSFTFYL